MWEMIGLGVGGFVAGVIVVGYVSLLVAIRREKQDNARHD